MRLMAILAVAVVLATGSVVTYILYRQLDTKIVALGVEPQLVDTARGRCGSAQFEVGARTLAHWEFPVEGGRLLAGELSVEGGGAMDIGFRVRAPHNRLVVADPRRSHRQQFEIDSTIRGAYTFEFDNRHSTFTTKHVALSLCVR